MASLAIKHKVRKVDNILRENTKGRAKESAYKTLAQIGVAVIGGGLAAAVIGRPSFLLGAGLAWYGNKQDISWLAPLGIGMMASSHLVPNESKSSVSGIDLKVETANATERLKSFGNSLLNKTYLDKFITKKSSGSTASQRSFNNDDTEEATNGFGSVQNNLQVLNNVEQQLVSSAMEMQNQRGSQSTQGFDDNVNGMDEPDFSGL